MPFLLNSEKKDWNLLGQAKPVTTSNLIGRKSLESLFLGKGQFKWKPHKTKGLKGATEQLGGPFDSLLLGL